MVSGERVWGFFAKVKSLRPCLERCLKPIRLGRKCGFDKVLHELQVVFTGVYLPSGDSGAAGESYRGSPKYC